MALAVPLTAQEWSNRLYWFGDTRTNLRNGNEVTHAALIGKPGPHQGKVVLVRASKESANGSIWLWDPAAPGSVGTAHPTDDPMDNIFCSVHSFDADGDLTILGGDRNPGAPVQCNPEEPNWSYVFDPTDLAWVRQGDMLDDVPLPGRPRYGHYYSASVALPGGLVAGIGGTSAPWDDTVCGLHPDGPSVNQNEWQIFDKASGAWFGRANDQAFAGLPGAGFRFTIYPLTHLLSNGYIFASVIPWGYQPTGGQPWSPSAYVNLAPIPANGTWTVKDPATPANWIRAGGINVNLRYATAFLWPWTVDPLNPQPIGSDRVSVIGGNDTNAAYTPGTGPGLGSPALANVWEIANPTNAASVWANAAPLNEPRVYANVVLLPNLTAVAVGGSRNFYKPYDNAPPANPNGQEVLADPVYEPEVLDLVNPATGWQLLSQAPHVSPRLYHSVAVLLKDGRVLVGGGYRSNVNYAPFAHSDAEIFSPDYLNADYVRPSIDNDVALPYDRQDFTVKLSHVAGTSIEFATLIRCASVTHHFDWDQRAIRLNVMSATATTVTLAGVPTIANNGEFIVPPGYYMLHVVTIPMAPGNVRVPSVAKFVKVG